MKGTKLKKFSYHFGLLLLAVVSFQIGTMSFAQQNQTLNQQAAGRLTYLAGLCDELNKKGSNRIINIICIGNSVPAGFTKAPLVDPFSAYPYLLHRGLKQKYPYAIINVIVSAKGGETSDKGLARYAKDVLLFAPDLITIDYGLTDRFLGLDKSRINLKLMIGLAKDFGIKVLLLTPTPDLKVNMDNPNDPLNQHAEQIRNVAEELKVGLVDSYAMFKLYVQKGGKIEGLLSNNRNHPNLNGHEIVAKEILKWFPR